MGQLVPNNLGSVLEIVCLSSSVTSCQLRKSEPMSNPHESVVGRCSDSAGDCAGGWCSDSAGDCGSGVSPGMFSNMFSNQSSAKYMLDGTFLEIVRILITGNISIDNTHIGW